MKRISLILLVVCLTVSLMANGQSEERSSTAGEVDLHYIIRAKLVDEAKERAVAQVKEDLGINLDLEVIDGNVWEEKINVLFAAGDFPDMFQFTDDNLEQIQLGMEEGIYHDLSGYVKSSPVYSGVDESRFALLSHNNKIYGLPTIVRYPLTIFVRDDWMSGLGLKDPTTPAGFKQMVKAFTEQDPDGNGKNDTAGFSWVGIKGWSAPYWKMFLPEVPGEYFIDKETGEIKNTAYLTEDVKTALSFFRDLYAQGVMSKTWISDQKSDVESKYINGQIGLWEKGAQYGTDRQSKMDAVGAGGRVGVLQPVIGKYGPNYSTFVDSGNPNFIMSEYEHPEAAISMIEYWVQGHWYEAYQLGTKGVDYTVEDGQIAYEESVDESMRLYNAGLWIELISGVEPPAINPQLMGVLKEVEGFEVVENPMVYVQKAESFDKVAALDAMRDEIVAQIIIGAQPVSAYDSFLTRYRRAGADEILQQANALK